MAITRPDVVIKAGTWTDLYAVTGIAVGTQVVVYNKGSKNCLVAVSSAAPTVRTMGIPLYGGPVGSYAVVSDGEVGLWAYSESGCTLLVQE